ncbi:ABC transporter ATP-binding protein [Oceanispirochaeta sp.]|uniref:ABC transporter ATP-binding protein n=1 Tax=Oceanispirochaeta sp. TaxID=2035350 RepID=UPI00262481DD|nr:energy-coupling factor transporter ATPase [Oceanispirochaeta sp.]MDA3957765.1 energy-coupling factor transporter ATPase [Oceanispirochaeta sp.]
MSFIEFRDVSFSYPGQDRPALDQVSFTLEPGSHTAIVGGNGSGKSTLARLLIGLLIPGHGQILVGGFVTSESRNHRSIRRKAGLVFQNPSSQIVATVVREDVAFGPENLVLDNHEIKERVKNALEDTSLSPLSLRGTHQLSAGQQQRLAMAGVLALGSRCMILDEAESMLNPSGRQQLNRLLAELKREGHTIIRITHFMEQAVLADRVIVLDHGRLAEQGDPFLFHHQRQQLRAWQLQETPSQLLSRHLSEEYADFPSSLTEEELIGSLKDHGFSCTPKESEDTESFLPGEPIISLRHVSRAYSKRSDSPVYALKNISFDLYPAESVSVLGQTGSGKSTFLQTLNSLLLPDEGVISLLNENPQNKKTDLRALRSRIGLVMQQPEKQLFASLVGDDVAFGPSQMGLKGRPLAQRVKEALELVGMPFDEYRDFSVKALSGGQKRKVALAGVLAMNPEILLLDEPTAGLDPVAADNLEKVLRDLQTRGLSLITVTHSMEQALRLSRRFVVFREGEIFWDGDAGGFFDLHDPVAVGLDYPLSSRIASSLGSAPAGRILTPEELILSLVPPAGRVVL